MNGLPDSIERERAVTTFDQNVVVEAGAGTGKTTLLIDRLVHLLLKEPEPVDINELVALTFTNKAANELKIRLREQLQAFLALDLTHPPTAPPGEDLYRKLIGIMARYHLSKAQIDERAGAALRDLEKAQIGTIHSFAAHLLRLYPLGAGVDPDFKEDEGGQFNQLFQKEWALWLDQELGERSGHKELWKGLLKQYDLTQLEALAQSLCNPCNPLQSLEESLTTPTTQGHIGHWLQGLVSKASKLLESYPKQITTRQMLISAQRSIQGILHGGIASTKDLLAEEETLARQIPNITKGWSAEDYQEAREIIQVAKCLFSLDHKLLSQCLELLLPFVIQFQQRFLQSGFISFDGLLVLACNLLQGNTPVRESLKRKYKAILVDEFQDTDPIQYEIILYLAEELGHQASHWRSIKLAPGKLFIVGDPKQSIYSFRRADIEAYHRIVQDIIQKQNGLVLQLKTNFRSHIGLLSPINTIFRQVIQHKEFLQPPYVELLPYHDRAARLSSQKVEFRIVDAGEEKLLAPGAVKAEAEALAGWLNEAVLGKEVILDTQGQECRIQPSHIALLFRKLTQVQEYLEALRRYDIPFVVEGERHFYTIQEVLDFINLLRAIENPYDTPALVGVLRSPLGGLTDLEIYELRKLALLDYRRAFKIQTPGLLKELFLCLYQLHDETRALPLADALGTILERLPVLELAAASFHREQAVANMKKIQLMAQELSYQPDITLKGFITLMEERVKAREEEGESPIMEEGVDAIRIMSIHKAKGLEFPVVVLAGLHSHTGGRDSSVWVRHDWSLGISGIRLGRCWSLPGVFLNRRAALREEEEEKRLLYVAMTRARERLVLSGVLTSSNPNPLQHLLSLIENSSDKDHGVEINYLKPSQALPGKRTTIKPQEDTGPKEGWRDYAHRWQKREELLRTTLEHKIFLNPSRLEEAEIGHWSLAIGQGVKDEDLLITTGGRGEKGLIIGDIAHRLLEKWSFSLDTKGFPALLAEVCLKYAPTLAPDEARSVHKELDQIFQTLFASPIYQELCQAKILGREIPFVIPWDGQVMEGVIDILYKVAGRVIVADYKTDRVKGKNITEWSKRYQTQADIYTEATRRCLGKKDAIFKLIFLAAGASVNLLKAAEGENFQIINPQG